MGEGHLRTDSQHLAARWLLDYRRGFYEEGLDKDLYNKYGFNHQYFRRSGEQACLYYPVAMAMLLGSVDFAERCIEGDSSDSRTSSRLMFRSCAKSSETKKTFPLQAFDYAEKTFGIPGGDQSWE